ncbi:MAG: XRE family transcriptional regulator [Proteobacteria bacterium]|nr:MAG: XRE family transcriptional regulator [Pseudomonadota bacterium]
MNCTAEEMKQLRYRLGYSQAEMARCLNLQLANISGFETGRESVPAELKSRVLQIFNLAEDNAERAHRRPIAEVMMRDLGLCQIPNFDIEG